MVDVGDDRHVAEFHVAFLGKEVARPSRNTPMLQRNMRPLWGGLSVRGFRPRVRSPATRSGRAGRAALERAAGARPVVEFPPPGLAQPHRQPPPVGRVGRTIDQAGADEHVDRAADRGLASPDGRGDLLQCRRFAFADRGQQLAPGALGPLGGAVGDIVVRDRGETRRQRGR